MSVSPSLNAAGRCQSPATLPGYFAGRPPRDKGLRYPADPPTVEKIVAAIREAGGGAHVARLRALIVLAYRAARPGGADADRARPRAARRVGARAPRQGRPAPRGRHGPVGLGTAPPSAHAADGDAGRSAAVRDRRADPWAGPRSGDAAGAQLRRVAAQLMVRRRTGSAWCPDLGPATRRR
jgi:hypothetical protein